MTASLPPQHNCVFGPPDGLDESQVFRILAFRGVVPSGTNLEGADFVTVAWRPSPDELERLNQGGLIYLTCLGSLPPHFLSTDFEAATYGQAKQVDQTGD